MKQISLVLWAAISLAANFTPARAIAQDLSQTTIVPGTCSPGSHIAYGSIGEDLKSKRSKFLCKAAVVSFLDKNNIRVMIQFGDPKADGLPLLAFVGNMERDGNILDVNTVYLRPGRPTTPIESVCKFFFHAKHMASVTCGARIEDGGQATVPIVVFISDRQ